MHTEIRVKSRNRDFYNEFLTCFIFNFCVPRTEADETKERLFSFFKCDWKRLFFISVIDNWRHLLRKGSPELLKTTHQNHLFYIFAYIAVVTDHEITSVWRAIQWQVLLSTSNNLSYRIIYGNENVSADPTSRWTAPVIGLLVTFFHFVHGS